MKELDTKPVPKKPNPPIFMETVEVIVGFFVMLGELLSGACVFVAGLFGCAVSSVVLLAVLLAIGAILMIFVSGP
jgi:hypothetical protein